MQPQEHETTIVVQPSDAGQRLDRFLASRLSPTSRARVQQLIAEGKVLVEGRVRKASFEVREGERIELLGEPSRPPLRAIAEEIPLDIVYEDEDLAVVNKPAGMMVHAGAGRADHEKSRGTLVNALLYRFGRLSGVGGELRPGIVHRLDRATSGLMVVAKNDSAHRKLAEEFSSRRVKKTYVALVHGWLADDRGTLKTAINRDLWRRSRMTTRRRGGREAITHYEVEKRLASEYGKFSWLHLRIDTGRTHQIRVHLASLGHPVVGDRLYGAPREIRSPSGASLSLARNFLHASRLEFRHPRSGEALAFRSAVPDALTEFVRRLGLNTRAPKRL